MTSPSDTPITDSLAFVNLDDVGTCKALERGLRQCAEALDILTDYAKESLAQRDSTLGNFRPLVRGIIVADIDLANAALAAVRELEEKYK